MRGEVSSYCFLLQVARLFQNDEDLLKEFGQFLPDAGGAVPAPPLPPLVSIR